jgi:two-component system, response regulator PdtaR
MKNKLAGTAQPTILLVDDDQLVLTTLAMGLRKEGYAVSVAASGNAALALAETQTFDIAIIDIRMPGMSGIELASRLREQWQIPGLFLSAYNDEKVVGAAVNEGALGYLVKPIDIPQFLPALKAALARAKDITALLKNKQQMEQALSGGRDTSVAIGILMERHGFSRIAAFEALRANARACGCRVESLASDLVAAEERLNGAADFARPSDRTP